MTDLKIMKLSEHDGYTIYRAACDCCDPDCDLTLELEKDKELPGLIFLNMYKKLRWASYTKSDHWYSSLSDRIRVALKILFTGFIEVEECFIFKGREHIESFVNALNKEKNKL